MLEASGTAFVFQVQILVHVQSFRYVLFASWFSWPDVIKGVKARQRDVVCMLKDMPKIHYMYQGKTYRLSELYKVVTKQNGKRPYIASVIVDYYGLPSRIVFVRNRNDKKGREWLALLSKHRPNYSRSWEILMKLKLLLPERKRSWKKP